MIKALIIGYVWPEPNSSAAGSHMMQIIQSFQSWGWQVEFASPAQFTDHMHDLNSVNVKCHPIKLNCDSFDHFIKTLSPDVVMFDRFMMEEQFGWRVQQHCPSAMRILDTEDLFFLRNARHAAVKKGLNYKEADLDTDMALREISAIYRSDVTLMISKAEIELLTQSFNLPRELLIHVPFMLDTEIDLSSLPSFEEREHFISIGNFRHPPNWDAVLQLREHIWPIIRKTLPKAELHIYGAYPPPKATALHNEKLGFLVKGWAEDAQAAMRGAKVCLAPLRFGAGIKGKLTEAMQCGTPSVTTSVGAEGMSEQHIWNGAVTDDYVTFAERAIALYTDKKHWLDKQANGLEILSTHYNADTIRRHFDMLIKRRLNNLTSSRQNNFVGKMLHHHQHRSTAFMSQWIAEKNR